MTIMKLKDDTEIEIKDNPMEAAFQVEVATLEDWGNIMPSLTEDNLLDFEITGNGITTSYTNKKMGNFYFSKTKNETYIVTVSLDDLSEEEKKILSLKQEINRQNTVIAQLMKSLVKFTKGDS